MEFPKEEKLYTEIVQKAWEDAHFKAELIADPVAAIEKMTGKKFILPAGKNLVVRDQTDASVYYINIPVQTSTEDVELNEDQLEAVAGGSIYPSGSFISIIDIFKPTPTFPEGPYQL